MRSLGLVVRWTAIISMGLFSWTGCQGTQVAVESGPSVSAQKEKGPPPWAPAHGYRAKHQYRYYPDVSVYFDVGRRLYFYYEGGRWKMSASLPRAIRIGTEDYVTIEMDAANPYEHHADVVKRFPPGLKTKKAKGKGKNKKSD